MSTYKARSETGALSFERCAYEVIPVDHFNSGSMTVPSAFLAFETVKAAKILVMLRKSDISARCIPLKQEVSR